MLHFHCHSCGREFHVSDEWAERRAKCATCGAVVQVPGLGAVAPSPGAAQDDWLAAADGPMVARPLQPVGPTSSQSRRMLLLGGGFAVAVVVLFLFVAAVMSNRPPAPASPPGTAPTVAASPTASAQAAAASPSAPAVVQSPGQGAPWPVFSDRYKWQFIVDPEGGFYVVMPDQPHRGLRDGLMPGASHSTAVILKPPTPLLCEAEWEDLNRAALWLHGGAEGVLSQLDELKNRPTCTHFRRIQLNGHPGVELTTRIAEGSKVGYLNTRQYIVGNRLYSLTWGATTESFDDPDVRAFFDSFGLGAPPAPPPGIPLGQPIQD